MKLRLALIAIGLAGGAAAQAQSAFDGTWDVSVVCPDHANARGYTLQFPAVVQGGVLQGAYRRGNNDAGSLQIEGPIRADGAARQHRALHGGGAVRRQSRHGPARADTTLRVHLRQAIDTRLRAGLRWRHRRGAGTFRPGRSGSSGDHVGPPGLGMTAWRAATPRMDG
jgi:hypothetical protein